MGFSKGTGPRRCPGCRGWFDVNEVKMTKVGVRLYCPDCKPFVVKPKRRPNSKKVTARAVAG